jgi:hypothetical protein
LYCVLTFDPARYRDSWEAFRAAGKCWDEHLRQGLRKQGGKVAYLQTWERHRSGWPHLNLILSGPDLRAWVESLGIVERRAESGRMCTFPRGWRRWLRAAAIRAGFGPVAWVEVLEPSKRDAMAGYLCKLAAELTGARSKKGDQAPTSAPKHFRRIRASRGLLPPLGTDEPSTWAGRIVCGRMSEEPNPARRPGVAPASRPAAWDDVLILTRRLREQARLDAGRWGAFYDRTSTAPILPDLLGSVPEQVPAERSPFGEASEAGKRNAQGERIDGEGQPDYFE